jgi:hypothetical protein
MIQLVDVDDKNLDLTFHLFDEEDDEVDLLIKNLMVLELENVNQVVGTAEVMDECMDNGKAFHSSK